MLNLFYIPFKIWILGFKPLITHKKKLLRRRLIVCNGGIGDLIIVVRLLKQQSSNLDFDLLTNSSCETWVKQTNPDIFNAVYSTKSSLLDQHRHYSSVHLIRPDNKSINILYSKKVCFNKLEINNHYDRIRFFQRLLIFLSRSYKDKYYKSFHISESYNDVLKIEKNANDKHVVDQKIKEINIDKLNIGIHPGASNAVRMMSIDSLLGVLKSHSNHNYFLFGSGQDSKNYPEERFHGFNNLKYLMGKLEFNSIDQMMCDIDLFICTDSMFLHYAELKNIPSIALMGPGPINMWGPLHQKSSVITRNPRCSPCKRKICDVYNGKSCIGDINAHEISLELDNFIKKIS
jgi:ADP-heptose:LPS heptosyltransferase